MSSQDEMVVSAPALSPGAARARRYRQRKRAGERCFQMQLTKAAVDALVRFDLLKTDQRGDAEVIRNAILALCHVGYQTLTEGRRGASGDAVVRLPEVALHRLVTHGFVGGGRRDEAAIAAGVEKLIAAWDRAAARWDLSEIWPSRPS
jgi:hypothetical protein